MAASLLGLVCAVARWRAGRDRGASASAAGNRCVRRDESEAHAARRPAVAGVAAAGESLTPSPDLSRDDSVGLPASPMLPFGCHVRGSYDAPLRSRLIWLPASP